MVNENNGSTSVFDRLSKGTTYATRERKNGKPTSATGLKAKKISTARSVETRPNSHAPRTRTLVKNPNTPSVKARNHTKPNRTARKAPEARKTKQTTTQPRAQKVGQKSISDPGIKIRSSVVRKNEKKSGALKVTPGVITKDESAPLEKSRKLPEQGMGISMRGLSVGPAHFSEGRVEELLDYDDDDMSFNEETSDTVVQNDCEDLIGNDGENKTEELADVAENIEEHKPPKSSPDDKDTNENICAHEQSVDMAASEEEPTEEHVPQSLRSDNGIPVISSPVQLEELGLGVDMVPPMETSSKSEPQKTILVDSNSADDANSSLAVPPVSPPLPQLAREEDDSVEIDLPENVSNANSAVPPPLPFPTQQESDDIANDSNANLASPVPLPLQPEGREEESEEKIVNNNDSSANLATHMPLQPTQQDEKEELEEAESDEKLSPSKGS